MLTLRTQLQHLLEDIEPFPDLVLLWASCFYARPLPPGVEVAKLRHTAPSPSKVELPSRGRTLAQFYVDPQGQQEYARVSR